MGKIRVNGASVKWSFTLAPFDTHFSLHFNIHPSALSIEEWAHQDSNLGRAGYEPAALTAELWARP